MTDYKWEIKQRRKQKDMFLNYRNVSPGDGNSTQIDSLRMQQSRTEVCFHSFVPFVSFEIDAVVIHTVCGC